MSITFPTKQAGIPLIGLWGMTKSGKTSFITALYGELNRYGASYNWTMIPCDPRSSGVWATKRMDEFWDGSFPPETRRGNENFYMFDLQPRDNQKKKFTFSFLDAAGEDLRIFDTPKTDDNNVDPIVAYLNYCDAVIMLIDPLPKKGETDFSQFINLLHRLYYFNGNKKLTKPMLFGITKCDMPPFREATESVEKATNLLATRFPPTLPTEITNCVEKPIIFGMSSVGFQVGQPPNLFHRYDGRIGIWDTKKIKPINVVESFELLAKALDT